MQMSQSLRDRNQADRWIPALIPGRLHSLRDRVELLAHSARDELEVVLLDHQHARATLLCNRERIDSAQLQELANP